MNDPILNAIWEHKLLAVGFVASLWVYMWGYMAWRTDKHVYIGGWCAVLGLAAFIDCMIRAIMGGAQ